MNKKIATIERINRSIKNSWKQIEESINKDWVKKHLIYPKKIRLCTDIDKKKSREFLLITDHIGKEDSSYRVAFDEENNIFGLECTMQDGTEWYMGGYGEFHDAINAM